MPRARRVKAAGKDSDGDITSLKGGFGTVSASQAIRDIKAGRARYSVGDSALQVVNGPTGQYLRTTADGRTGNNLDELPDA